ncbi:L-2-hydroxyglutarate oxidase [soil metagenome]
MTPPESYLFKLIFISLKNYDVIIIGAGIVGLATALKILEKDPTLKLGILEKEKGIARHQTGHNSGVIHSGIYYKPGSLKAINCIQGYNMLLDFVKKENIKYNLCGKIVVAINEAELPSLDNIYNRGIENGLKGIRYISKAEMKEIEPHVNGTKGIFVPQTGIIDYKEVSQKFAEKITNAGGEIFTNEEVISIKKDGNELRVISLTGEYSSKLLINCAGLFSDKVTSMTNKKVEFRIIPFRGEYYKLKKEKEYLVKNLIYPVPDPAFPFLGVHFTRMIGGGIEAGPNAVLSFKKEGYKRSDFSFIDTVKTLSWPGFQKVAFKYWKTGFGEFHRSYSIKAFTKALQQLIPELQEDDLVPGGAGVRAQASDRNGGLIDDFLIVEDKNVINVCNAPSPAATSSLSIGNKISGMAIEKIQK